MEKIKVDKKNKAVVIGFNSRLYPLPDILDAARSFSEHFWTYVDGDPQDSIYVVLTPKDRTPLKLESIGREFYNYTLGIIKNRT